jgi:hypothetical protein
MATPHQIDDRNGSWVVRLGRSARFVATVTIAAGVLAVGAGATTAAAPPDGYEEVPGSPDVLLDPADIGVAASAYPSQCPPEPFPVGAGQVAWRFVLPLSDAERATGNPAGRGGNVFDLLTVTFAKAGTITFANIRPQSVTSAWVLTDSDDVIVAGQADIFRLSDLAREDERTFDLVATCAEATATPPSTTIAAEPTSPSGTSDPSPAAAPPPAESGPPSGRSTTTTQPLPATGRPSLGIVGAALATTTLGIALVFATRTRAS